MFIRQEEARSYKNGLGKRAFRVIFTHLLHKGEISIGEFFKILSGVRLQDNPKCLSKINKTTSKSFLRKWHKTGLITVFRGKVRLTLSPVLFRMIDHEVLLKLIANKKGGRN